MYSVDNSYCHVQQVTISVELSHSYWGGPREISFTMYAYWVTVLSRILVAVGPVQDSSWYLTYDIYRAVEVVV